MPNERKKSALESQNWQKKILGTKLLECTTISGSVLYTYIRVAPLDEFKIGHDTSFRLDYSEHFSPYNLGPPRLRYFETASQSLRQNTWKCPNFLLLLRFLAGQITLMLAITELRFYFHFKTLTQLCGLREGRGCWTNKNTNVNCRFVIISCVKV